MAVWLHPRADLASGSSVRIRRTARGTSKSHNCKITGSWRSGRIWSAAACCRFRRACSLARSGRAASCPPRKREQAPALHIDDDFDVPLGGQREPLLDDVVPRYDTLQCTTKHYDEAKQREDWTKDVEKTPADKCKRVFRPLYEDRVTPPFCAMHRGTSRAH